MSSTSKYKTKVNRKKFYNSSAWQRVRQRALERDNFECQECKRLGYVHVDSERVASKRKTVELNVHHKKEIETNPELALDIDNLETLCIRHHNEIHDKPFVKRKNKWADDEKW